MKHLYQRIRDDIEARIMSGEWPPGHRVPFEHELMDDVPGAYEQRLINLATVPEASQERFAADPPGTWLLRRVPWTDAEHVVRAANADGTLARRLHIEKGAACLVLERR